MTKIHVTKTAEDTSFDNCEFGIDFKNDGARTQVRKSKFMSLQSRASFRWFILTVVAGLVVAGIAYYLGWN